MEEISDENLALLKKRYKTTLFIVLAQVISAVILLVAAWLLTRERIAHSDSFLTLWLVILFISAATFVLRRQFFNWERLKNAALLKGVSGLIGVLQINTIVLNVFAQIVVFIGFVICFFTGYFVDMLRAAGIALIVFALNFPRFSLWKKIVSNLEKV